ncbi:MAG: hypothetical protein DI629_17175 [Mesorhizobium amorphae]|nr:MAG: hypothetical protein DI629_17175 [Mesorhizobium amorphae]
MIVEFFLKWAQTAPASERAAAAAALARSFCEDTLSLEDRCAAEGALALLLDDPSAKVRAAMADALSVSRHAPSAVVAALAADQPDVAAPILGRSPLLTDGDLIDCVASAPLGSQLVIAGRPFVSMPVAAALAEMGDASVAAALLANDGAEIASVSFRRITERHGHLGAIRERLVADPRLPADCRHMLLLKLGEALRSAPLVAGLMGSARAERVTRDACLRSSVALVEGTPETEHSALVEHLRLRGELTGSFVLRLVAHGRVDFFAAVLSALSGRDLARIHALLRGGARGSLIALFRKSGLAAALDAVLLTGLDSWRAVMSRGRQAGVQEVSYAMLGAAKAEEGGEIATLLKSIHLDALRANARAHARSLAA